MPRIAVVLALAVGLLAAGASASTELASKTVLAQANILVRGAALRPNRAAAGAASCRPGGACQRARGGS